MSKPSKKALSARAKKAWKTRRANAKKPAAKKAQAKVYSMAAYKAWRTRRANAKAKGKKRKAG